MEQEKIQQIQFLEQNLQAVIMQKQSFEMDLEETILSASEIKKTDTPVFKIIGQLMIKSDKNKTIHELEEKQKIIEMRISALTKQEESIQKQIKDMRDELLGNLNKNKSK